MQEMVVVGLIVEELSNINGKWSRSPGQGTCQASAIMSQSQEVRERFHARFDGFLVL